MDELTRWIDDSGWAALQAAPMPGYSGPEPDELALMRIQKRVAEGRFDALSRDERRWVCRRLLPSLVRFGRYPPPDEPPATPALPGDSEVEAPARHPPGGVKRAADHPPPAGESGVRPPGAVL